MDINSLNKHLINVIAKNKSQTEIDLLTIEELSELQQAVLKIRRSITGDKSLNISPSEANINLIEEIADVYIMLQQLQYTHIISDKDINKIITEKCERTLKKLSV